MPSAARRVGAPWPHGDVARGGSQTHGPLSSTALMMQSASAPTGLQGLALGGGEALGAEPYDDGLLLATPCNEVVMIDARVRTAAWLAERRHRSRSVGSTCDGETAGFLAVEEAVVERSDMERTGSAGEQALESPSVDHLAREIAELSADPGEFDSKPSRGWTGGDRAQLPVLAALEDVGRLPEMTLGLDLCHEPGRRSAGVAKEC